MPLIIPLTWGLSSKNVTRSTPLILFQFVTDICESPPSAVYTEKSLFPSGCQAISSGHLLCFWDAQSVELSREADDPLAWTFQKLTNPSKALVAKS
uniref:Uncharacterized protein n=1 Tax=Medicago truncatula TaxID=3880 RepID=I3SHA8_MEDTR|nr:unknown [Medicago truncatula]